MTKYIKCDEDFIDRAMRACGPCTTAVIGITELLEQEVGADVEKIVRCKNCKKYGIDRDKGGFCLRHQSPSMWTNGIDELEPDDFCSYGERKEGMNK